MKPLQETAAVRILRAAFALAAALAASAGASASPIDSGRLDGPIHTLTYSTSLVSRTPEGGEGLAGLSFQGVEGQTVQTAAPFAAYSFPWALTDDSTAEMPLGSLAFLAPSAGVQDGRETLEIAVRIDAIDGVRLADPITATIQAVAAGRLQADGDSRVQFGVAGYSVTPPYTPPLATAATFSDGALEYRILAHDVEFKDVTFASGLATSLDARLITAQVVNTPEPATWAVFAIVGLAAGLRARKPAGARASG